MRTRLGVFFLSWLTFSVTSGDQQVSCWYNYLSPWPHILCKISRTWCSQLAILALGIQNAGLPLTLNSKSLPVHWIYVFSHLSRYYSLFENEKHVRIIAPEQLRKIFFGGLFQSILSNELVRVLLYAAISRNFIISSFYGFSYDLLWARYFHEEVNRQSQSSIRSTYRFELGVSMESDSIGSINIRLKFRFEHVTSWSKHDKAEIQWRARPQESTLRTFHGER